MIDGGTGPVQYRAVNATQPNLRYPNVGPRKSVRAGNEGPAPTVGSDGVEPKRGLDRVAIPLVGQARVGRRT
jgi:hypothetical protein